MLVAEVVGEEVWQHEKGVHQCEGGSDGETGQRMQRAHAWTSEIKD